MTEAKQNLHSNYAKTLKIKAIFLARLPPLSCFSRKMASSILSKFKWLTLYLAVKPPKLLFCAGKFYLANHSLRPHKAFCLLCYTRYKRKGVFASLCFPFLFLVIAKGVSLEAIPLNSRFRLLRQPTASSQ